MRRSTGLQNIAIDCKDSIYLTLLGGEPQALLTFSIKEVIKELTSIEIKRLNMLI